MNTIYVVTCSDCHELSIIAAFSEGRRDEAERLVAAMGGEAAGYGMTGVPLDPALPPPGMRCWFVALFVNENQRHLSTVQEAPIIASRREHLEEVLHNGRHYQLFHTRCVARDAAQALEEAAARYQAWQHEAERAAEQQQEGRQDG